MEQMFCFLILLLVFSTVCVNRTTAYQQAPNLHATRQGSCDAKSPTCELTLIIEEKLTMMHGSTALVTYNGLLYKYADVMAVANAGWRYNLLAGSEVNPDEVLVADGFRVPRLAITANGSLPAPPIEAYEDQEMVIKVVNRLRTENVAIHWHGIHQIDTPWMDGTAFVTQCPILPGQEFTYRFIAGPGGTHMYYSSIGDQRSVGLYGAFVVKSNSTTNHNAAAESGEPEREHVVVLSDWSHYTTDKELITRPSRDPNLAQSSKRIQSILVNGRGRNNDRLHQTFSPLTEFHVELLTVYRFRMINAASESTFKVSVFGNQVDVVAVDGSEIQPVKVDYINIGPGERVDFLLDVMSLQDTWLHAEAGIITGDAIIRINDPRLPTVGKTERQEPFAIPRQCTIAKPCVEFACPFSNYGPAAVSTCLNWNTINAAAGSPTVPSFSASSVELFMNFGFPSAGVNYRPGSVNGIRFVQPTGSLLTSRWSHSNGILSTPCTDQSGCSGVAICNCTSSVELAAGATVQLVLSSIGEGRAQVPAHLHGHRFHVLKVAFARLSSETGRVTDDNSDLECANGTTKLPFCNRVRWSNTSLTGDDVTNLNLVNPPLKDSVTIPSGGYVVLRFKADNPGLWLLHSMVVDQQESGMATLLSEAEDRVPYPPRGFPQCGSFNGNFKINRFNDQQYKKETRVVSDKNAVVEKTAKIGNERGLNQRRE
ncbi:uncharacterized protein LOC141910578 [Tubulanus polymorphus]|uniref:uncharacterized protein LOC141910578 n=1 Tax=Tubulanus polymorphus TaxID=672921 RepID=UPI003DA67FC1